MQWENEVQHVFLVADSGNRNSQTERCRNGGPVCRISLLWGLRQPAGTQVGQL